jgi:hypothetical protein
MMNRILATATVSLALILSGLVHGRWTDRWTTSAAPTEAAARFDKVAELSIGEWGKGETIDVPRTRADEQIAGTLQRRYQNAPRNQEIAIALVCGRPGPVSIHSPDICYTASGYTVGTPTRITVPGTRATFWTATATLTNATKESRLRLFWAWNAGEGWTASEDPRVAFARRPVLHKLYVVRELDNLNEKLEEDPSLKFMQELLRELEPTLFQQGA